MLSLGPHTPLARFDFRIWWQSATCSMCVAISTSIRREPSMRRHCVIARTLLLLLDGFRGAGQGATSRTRNNMTCRQRRPDCRTRFQFVRGNYDIYTVNHIPKQKRPLANSHYTTLTHRHTTPFLAPQCQGFGGGHSIVAREDMTSYEQTGFQLQLRHSLEPRARPPSQSQPVCTRFCSTAAGSNV